MALTSKIRLQVNANQVNAIDLGESRSSRVLDVAVSLASGTGAGQGDLVFVDTRTLAASATEDLDLSGALADAFGVAQVFARVKALVIQAAVGNTNNVNVTRPASNGWPVFLAAGDGIGLRPGETLVLTCGVADAVGHAVTAGTGDLLTVTNSAGTTGVDYSIAIIGCSA